MADQEEWEPMLQRTYAKLKQALSKLQKTWEDIGCAKEIRTMYYDQAHNHINDLLIEMMTESDTKKQLLLQNVEDLLKQTTTLYGELHLDSSPKSYEQVPLSKVEQMLRVDLQNLECLKKERLRILKELLAKEHEITKRLGAKKLSISTDELPTEQELESFKLYIQKQEDEKNRLENVYKDMRWSIVKIMKELDISPSSSFEHMVYNNSEDFVLNASNMTRLREFRDQLQEQVSERMHQIEDMKEELLSLWKSLGESEENQSFFDKYPGYNTDTMNALKKQIQLCKEKRKKNISVHILQLRHELVNLWDLCKYSKAQKSLFTPYYYDEFVEDLLTLHEIEVERLRKFYNDNQAIFDLLEQREDCFKKTKELIQRANDPDRFHNRGGQLLMEERERKIIQKKLPKIEENLKQLIEEYEKTHNRTFTIYGQTLDDILAESWKNINHEKETVRKGRKDAKDKSMKKSPLNCSRKTPGTSHLSIPKVTPSLSKRKLFSPSPNTSAKRRNKNGDKVKPTVSGSKIRRSGRLKSMQKGHKSAFSRKSTDSANNSVADSTYHQFQGHMTAREELHSSLLPEQILKTTNKFNVRTPVRTPAKPLRKNLSAASTPVHNLRKSPHSPRIVSTPKLATAPSTLPFIF